MSRSKEGHDTTTNNRRNAIAVGSLLAVAILFLGCFMVGATGTSTTGAADASMVNGIHAAPKTPKPATPTTTAATRPPAPSTSASHSTAYQEPTHAPIAPLPTTSSERPPRPAKPTRPTPPPAMGLTDIQSYAYALVGANQFACLSNIIRRESGWNPYAANSDGSFGIPQALPGNKMASAGSDWQTNPKTQLRWMVNYVRSRYGTPCNAWAFWQEHSWY